MLSSPLKQAPNGAPLSSLPLFYTGALGSDPVSFLGNQRGADVVVLLSCLAPGMLNGHFFLLLLVCSDTALEAPVLGTASDESGSAGTWWCSWDFSVLP